MINESIKNLIKKIIKEEIEKSNYVDDQEANDYLNKVRDSADKETFQKVLNVYKRKGLDAAKEIYNIDDESNIESRSTEELMNKFVDYLDDMFLDMYEFTKSRHNKPAQTVLSHLLGYYVHRYGDEISKNEANKISYILDSKHGFKDIAKRISTKFKKVLY
jgi:hypothetical protein